MNDDAALFDLRPYLDLLVRRWRLIISVAVLTTMAVAFYSLLSPPPYQAEALVAIVKAKTDVTFDPRFRTLSDEDLAAAGATQAINAEARRNALLGLVQNGAIANKVIETFGNQFEPQQRDPALLMRKVSAQIVGKGDLISISVKDSDRQRAAAIANAWAAEYERLTNSVYGGAPDSFSSSVSAEFAAAASDYEKAQKAVEEFTAHNRIVDLTRSIAEKQLIVKSLEDSRNAVFNKQIEAKLLTLNNAYETRIRTERLLADARALQAQAIQGGAASSSTNNLSLLLLKAEVLCFVGGNSTRQPAASVGRNGPTGCGRPGTGGRPSGLGGYRGEADRRSGCVDRPGIQGSAQQRGIRLAFISCGWNRSLEPEYRWPGRAGQGDAGRTGATTGYTEKPGAGPRYRLGELHHARAQASRGGHLQRRDGQRSALRGAGRAARGPLCIACDKALHRNIRRNRDRGSPCPGDELPRPRAISTTETREKAHILADRSRLGFD